MDEKHIDLLKKTGALFMQFGIKSMTMDDIARQLAMSKKTIYQYVSDKNDLVVQTMQLLINFEKEVSHQICKVNENAIDMLFELSKDIGQKFGQIHPSINYDLQKYHPEAWGIFMSFKKDFVADCIEQNIRKGIEQGLYRENQDPFVTARFYSNRIDLLMDADIFPRDKYSFQQLHLEMMRYHIRGLASEKGLEYLKQKINTEQIQL